MFKKLLRLAKIGKLRKQAHLASAGVGIEEF
jgi:hypothetical protein